MSSGAEQVLKSLFELARTQGGKILYPGLPFLLVPSLLASLIIGQFSGNLTHYPNDQPSALELSAGFSPTSGPRSHATLLVVPTAAEFFLRSSGSGIESAWLSIEPSKLRSNSERVTLTAAGLEIGTLRGVAYPLVVVVEGEHENEIDPAGQQSHVLPRLELTTSLSNWVVFFLLGGAIFGFGVSTGFVNDGFVAEDKDA